jgi:hypothetical protein
MREHAAVVLSMRPGQSTRGRITPTPIPRPAPFTIVSRFICMVFGGTLALEAEGGDLPRDEAVDAVSTRP